MICRVDKVETFNTEKNGHYLFKFQNSNLDALTLFGTYAYTGVLPKPAISFIGTSRVLLDCAHGANGTNWTSVLLDCAHGADVFVGCLYFVHMQME